MSWMPQNATFYSGYSYDKNMLLQHEKDRYLMEFYCGHLLAMSYKDVFEDIVYDVMKIPCQKSEAECECDQHDGISVDYDKQPSFILIEYNLDKLVEHVNEEEVTAVFLNKMSKFYKKGVENVIVPNFYLDIESRKDIWERIASADGISKKFSQLVLDYMYDDPCKGTQQIFLWPSYINALENGILD